jgi:hypothetical protein
MPSCGTRRALVVCALASAALLSLPAVLVLGGRRWGHDAELVPFKQAAPPDLLVGAAYNDFRIWSLGSSAEEATYDSIFERNFDLVENSCKMITIMPSRDGPLDFAPCERVLA